MIRNRPLAGQSRARRGVATIMFGTGFGSALGLILSPVITRLFDPSSFGTFVILTSVAMVLTPMLSLRLELAVPLPKQEAAAWALVHAGLLVCLLVAATLSTLLAVAGNTLLGGPVADWLWVTPLMAAAMATFTALNAMAIRHSRYPAIARRNVLMAVSSLGLQIAAGLMGYGVGGLVVGFALGQIVGAGSLLIGAGIRSTDAREGRRAALVVRTVRRYRRIPTLLALAGVINVLGLQAPVFLLAQFFGEDVVGWFGLTLRVLATPVTLIGLAVAQVYLSEIARTRRQSNSGGAEYFSKASKALLAIGILIGGTIFIFAPTVFGMVFGGEWEESGHYARALAVALIAQLVASPLSQTLIVYERSMLQLGWDCFRLAIVTTAVTVPALLGMPPDQTVWALGAALTLSYAVSWDLSRRTVLVRREPIRT